VCEQREEFSMIKILLGYAALVTVIGCGMVYGVTVYLASFN